MIRNKIIKIFKEVADSKSKTFFFVCLFFIFGIGLASILIKNYIDIFWFFCLAVIGSVLLYIYWKNPKIRLLIFLGLFLILGAMRYVSILPIGTDREVKSHNGQTVNLIAVIDDEPDIRESHTKLTVRALSVKNKKVDGKVLVKIPRYPEYNYGDKLSIVCNLEDPPAYEDFDYASYLSKDQIYSLCNYPKNIQVLEENVGNPIIAGIYKIKNKFAEITGKIFPEPHASFLGGLLYGERRGIPPEIKEEFKETGVTHIIAISGYNITIVVGMFFIFLMVLFVPRKYAFWVALLGIAVFVILTGAEASVIRAAIMGFVVLTAREVGRPSKITNALAFSAAGMLLHNPKLLVFDIGFQLSFAATLGLVYVSPILVKKFKKIPSFWELKKTFLETISAIVATLPLTLFYFGSVSLVAPIVNIAILLFIPWVMFFGFFAGILGLIWLPLGQVAGIIAWAIMTYILEIISLFAKFGYVFQI